MHDGYLLKKKPAGDWAGYNTKFFTIYVLIRRFECFFNKVKKSGLRMKFILKTNFSI